MIEDKKFKLTKRNLDIIQLIQHIVYINISTYKNMCDRDWNESSVIHEHELICDSYLKLHSSHSVMNLWDSGMESFKVRTYLIGEFSEPDNRYILRIELDKSYHDCCKLGRFISGRVIEPVSINIFNIEFVSD